MTRAGSAGGPSLGERRLAEETRERFLREIVARVPLDRLAAVHLFRPIRQGGYESGVAVIAAEPPAPPEATLLAEPAPGEDAIGAPACDPTEAAAGGAPVERPADADGDAPSGDAPNGEPDAEPNLVSDVEPDAEPDADPADASEEPPAAPRPARHTVFMARYRLAIKGPDRGKWEAEVVEEADAPLVTVEAVVRGVQRRAGDDADPERLDGQAVARLVGGAR